MKQSGVTRGPFYRSRTRTLSDTLAYRTILIVLRESGYREEMPGLRAAFFPLPPKGGSPQKGIVMGLYMVLGVLLLAVTVWLLYRGVLQQVLISWLLQARDTLASWVLPWWK